MKRVLVVDDSEVNLFLISSIFENVPDIHIHILNDSKQTLSVLREGTVDLLILDLMMPYVDGFQLLEQIKADSTLSHIPIFVISARYDKEAYDIVSQYKVEDYIKKPINLDEIELKIRQILHLVSS